MKKKPSITKYCLNFIVAVFSLHQLIAADTTSYNPKYFIGATTALAALAYGGYLYLQQPTILTIPDAATSTIKTIIFDIDGVLTSTNKLRAFQEVGIGSTLWPIARDLQVPSEKLLFDTLAQVPAISTASSYNKGLRMPQIMIDWQTNAQSIPEIQAAVELYLTTSFEPESVKNWVSQTVRMMTDPASFIATRQTIPTNIALLHELKEKGYKLYILSNWDLTSFPLFKAAFSEIFMYKNKELFDGIMISGEVGIVKPDITIFEKCLHRFHLKAHESLFIDDESANIVTAQQICIQTVYANPNNPQAIRKNLIQQVSR